MRDSVVRIGAAAGACAVAAGVLISVLSAPDGQLATVVAKPKPPTTAVTNVSRDEIAPTEPSVEKAVPQITGPAPLPVEEQGVPGN